MPILNNEALVTSAKASPSPWEGLGEGLRGLPIFLF